METLGERVARAREEKGWSQKELAERVRRINRELDTQQSTVHSLESGGVKRPRYLRELSIVLDVSEGWLLTGDGQMRRSSARAIPVMGKVCGGDHVDFFDQREPPESISLAEPSTLAALQVDGPSMYPRFHHGEFILYDKNPVPPVMLLNQYAIVQTMTGETMIKILREGNGQLFTLESHNALPIRNANLLCAFRYLGVIPRPDLFLPEKRKRG
ncbi:MAG: S24 family peptidase [Methylocystis sp.]